MAVSVLNLTDNRQLPRLALVAAVVLLLATVAWHVNRRLSVTSIGTAGEAPAPPTDATPASPPADMSVLSQWQPYGSLPAAASGPAEPLVVAPSPLNIQLRGVVAARNGEAGEAIIANESGIERSYSIGDSVADGVTLHAINARDVVIERGGALESIALPAVPSAGGGDAPPLPEATNVPMAQPPEQAQPPSAEAAPADPTNGGTPPAIVPPQPAPPIEALPPGNE